MRFHNGEIAVQERAQARNFADEVGQGIADFVTPGTKDFLQQRRMIVLGTVISDGSVWASVITGELGFIRIHDTNIQSIRISTTLSKLEFSGAI
jgi:uncharacterized protein